VPVTDFTHIKDEFAERRRRIEAWKENNRDLDRIWKMKQAA
jgi:hypothetical protein